MKTLVISDIHLNKNNYQYYYEILFPFIKESINRYNIENIILLGDVFTSSNIDNISLKLFKNLVNILNKCNIKIINGNHDIINNEESIFDILILNDNISIYDDVYYQDNNIFVPYIIKKNKYDEIFNNIKNYLTESKYDDIFIYSHNDFAEVYKFKNNFFNISDTFEGINKNIYLINGHNHVPYFNKYDNLIILNLGCAINTNYNDTALYNNFLIIDNNDLKIIQNKYSIQYYTFNIYTKEDIDKYCDTLTKENISYIKFIIHSSSIVISDEYKEYLNNNYLIEEIHIEYELNSLMNLAVQCDNDIDNVSLDDICKELNLDVKEFINISNEKLEILLVLLKLMFNDRETSKNDSDKVLEVIKKYVTS